jgi:transketolase
MAKDRRPNYMRVTREATPIFTTADTPFEIGTAYVLEEGEDVTVIATGTMTYQALLTVDMLYKHGIDVEVVHVPTIKPLDADTILKSVQKTKHVVTVEEAQINGGLGGAIAELLGEHYPVPIKRMGMHDHFGESGTPEELLDYFGLTAKDIVKTVQTLLAKG